MNTANIFTCYRLLIGPLFILIYLHYPWLGLSFKAMPYVLLALVITAELTDIFDGYYARRFSQVTRLGKILDPMSDSLYRNSIFIAFTQPPVDLPLILVLVFIYRDVMISTLRTICALDGFTLSARPSGKLKAIIQAVAIFVLLFLLIAFSEKLITERSLVLTSSIIVAIAAFYSLVSGWDYFSANRSHIQKLLRD